MTLRLTTRGSIHLSALQARRNEGDDHVERLTDLVMFFGSCHIAVTIPEKIAGVLMPDGQFRHGDSIYNVDVECSTVAKVAEERVHGGKGFGGAWRAHRGHRHAVSAEASGRAIRARAQAVPS